MGGADAFTFSQFLEATVRCALKGFIEKGGRPPLSPTRFETMWHEWLEQSFLPHAQASRLADADVEEALASGGAPLAETQRVHSELPRTLARLFERFADGGPKGASDLRTRAGVSLARFVEMAVLMCSPRQRTKIISAVREVARTAFILRLPQATLYRTCGGPRRLSRPCFYSAVVSMALAIHNLTVALADDSSSDVELNVELLRQPANCDAKLLGNALVAMERALHPLASLDAPSPHRAGVEMMLESAAGVPAPASARQML